MRKFFTLFCFFFLVIMGIAQAKVNIPKGAYRISMKSYYELYGKTPESVKLIKIFDKRRKMGVIFTTLGSALCLPSWWAYRYRSGTQDIFPISSLALAIPTFGLGLGIEISYNRKRLYRYLIHDLSIPQNLQRKQTN